MINTKLVGLMVLFGLTLSLVTAANIAKFFDKSDQSWHQNYKRTLKINNSTSLRDKRQTGKQRTPETALFVTPNVNDDSPDVPEITVPAAVTGNTRSSILSGDSSGDDDNSDIDVVDSGDDEEEEGSAKKHHLHHHKKNVTIAGKVKSTVVGKPKSAISKKQSLGMPLNNNDEQGLGGEPVGHLDASEGVGGLGGDQDGVPIGMGAGAEPLGMTTGKEMPNGMDGNGGGVMHGLSEEGGGETMMHGGNGEGTRGFSDQGGEQEGDFIEGGEHGGNMMGQGGANHFMPSSGGRHGGMNMMNGGGGGGGGGMDTFLGQDGNGGGMGGNNFMGNGEGGPGGNGGGNFIGQAGDDESSYRGPKKDPLGGEIKPFNDEYKNNGGRHHGGEHGMSPMAHHGGGNGFPGNRMSPMGHGISSYQPMGNDEGGDRGMDGGDGGMGGSEHPFTNPSNPGDISEALNGNLAALDKVNIQGDNDVAEMVRKATHQKEFAQNQDSGTFNGISLMEPGFSSTTKHFFSNGNSRSDRRTKDVQGSHLRSDSRKTGSSKLRASKYSVSSKRRKIKNPQ